MMYYGYGNSFFPHMFGFGFGFLNILFWVFLVYLFIKILRSSESHKKHDSYKAMEILKERYAKGEINKEQFESMKKDLS